MQSLPIYNGNHPQDQLLDQDPNTLKKFHMEIIWVNSHFKEGEKKKGKKNLSYWSCRGIAHSCLFQGSVCQATLTDKVYNLEHSFVSFNFLYTYTE